MCQLHRVPHELSM